MFSPEMGKKAGKWWDIPKGLSSYQFRKLVQLKNTEVLSDLVENPSRLGLTTHADEIPSHNAATNDHHVPAAYPRKVPEYLQKSEEMKQIAAQRGDFTPLTDPYKALGSLTVFDELLIRKALNSHIPDLLLSMENMRPRTRYRLMRQQTDGQHGTHGIRPDASNEDALDQESVTRSNLPQLLNQPFRPTGSLRTKSDGGFISWKMFMKEMRRCVNKVVKGRELGDFLDQSDQFVMAALQKMKLQSIVALMHDSPHLGTVHHLVYSIQQLEKLFDSTDEPTKQIERTCFSRYIRWIDIILTSLSNVRLREILSWHPLSFDRLEELRHHFDMEALSRSPSVTFNPKFRSQRQEDGDGSGSDTLSKTGPSNMNAKEQQQLLWRKFHRNKLAGRFDRHCPSSDGVNEWRFKSYPPWLESMSKVQTRFQAVKSEISLQTLAKKTQRKVNEDNAEDLIRAMHERWLKAERAKRVKYEKFLDRKKESVFATLRNPKQQQKKLRTSREKMQDNFQQSKDKLRVNTWFEDLKDQCRLVMGSTKTTRYVERFSKIPWDHFNFALERYALVLCSLPGSDLLDYQLQAAARFVLREIFSGPDDLISRCYKFRGLPYDKPFLRPGRGDSIIVQSKPIFALINERRTTGYQPGFMAEARSAVRLTPGRRRLAATADALSDSAYHGTTLGDYHRNKLRRSLRPVHLTARSPQPNSKRQT
ncbi:uncharacterized protein LOC129590103 isoform X2 [Paramacrobiotus metropolitanus]|uniref:uncharacterized protein LOC129590103 isoform X2 n=1 Tax=Paramacrobiotus metropolitanus TaxID=2943436 RepID=UPI002445C3BA|nr:uncharacterized protein LOC129590103 isoform X2 [Paramacrobiotus metropolitanus]